MTLWIIEPRDPLIVRDGRPFGPTPGARAASLPFPLPSTVIGGLRHKAGLSRNGEFDRNQIATVLNLSLRGPILATLHAEQDTVQQMLFPAPADALPLLIEGQANQVQLLRLAPRAALAQAQTNQPDGLALLGPAERNPNKVSSDAPTFWYEQWFMQWLRAPSEVTQYALAELGIGALATSSRTHVSVEPTTQTAREGALFQTRGLEFTWRDWEAQRQTNTFITQRLALLAAFEQAGQPYTPPYFAEGIYPLGGERRLMRWQQLKHTLPEPPDDLFSQIIATRRARVILLTPALFTAGYRPPMHWERGGVVAHLRAAAVPRAQVVSGWDMNADNGVDAHGRPRPRGKPKPTRRMAPAGAVYFIEWDAGVDVAAWLAASWMQNVSDDVQDQRDGFGLAALGVWPHEAKEPTP